MPSKRPSGRGVRRSGAGTALALLVVAAPALAQDTHYWSVQYGPVGQLVGGQLIGGVNDLSATFYNPGALALRNESSYLLSTESFQWETLSTETAGPAVLDTSSSSLGAAPSLLAGALPHWFGDRTHLAWSFLTRQRLDVRLGERVTDPLPSPWLRSASESYFDQDLEEAWGGLTVSRAVSDSVGVGLTWYGVYRGQRVRKELSLEAVDGPRSLAASGVADFQYSHYRTLAKLGVAWQTPVMECGALDHDPEPRRLWQREGRLHPFPGRRGRQPGRRHRQPEPRQRHGRGPRQQLPFVLGGGSGRVAPPGGHEDLRQCRVVRPGRALHRHRAPGGHHGVGAPHPGAAGVLNGGVGIEHVVSEDVSVYGAFHTDFSAFAGSAQANVAISDWDLYHVSGGVSFRIHDNRFTLGASWATGGTTRALDSPIPPEAFPGAQLGTDAKIRYSKLTFLLGFVFGR